MRAVSVPMKLRMGYYCGRPSEDVAGFESLANAAATTLAGSPDIREHVFGSDLSDIFRKPRGGVRYIFGEVSGVPNQFIARGWDAGAMQFENGVLIDLPISEQRPDAGHWLLLLHRLGWRYVDGSPLRANRRAWHGNGEVSLEMLAHDWSRYPPEFAKNFTSISKDTFYSVIGTKDAPLDINLASAFAIQLLLSSLSTQTTLPQESVAPAVDYSDEHWKSLEIPPLRDVSLNEATGICQPKVGVLVATEVERLAVLKRMKPCRSKRDVLRVFAGSNTFFVGRLGVTEVVLCMTAMGSTGRDGSTIVTAEVLQQWELAAVIMAGIAFGRDATKQEIGTVLVSDRIIAYDPQRIGKASSEDRGAQPMAGQVLLNRFRNVLGWHFTSPDGRACSFQIGPLLSGEKLVDNPEFKQTLFDRFPAAIGGEMEGAGVAAAAERSRREWIVVKAICDWGDGTKTKDHQEFAAASSVHFVEHVLNQPGALDSLG